MKINLKNSENRRIDMIFTLVLIFLWLCNFGVKLIAFTARILKLTHYLHVIHLNVY